MLATTRKGRAVLNVDAPARLRIVAAAEGDHVAIIGENRKLLVFPLDEAPRMARGKGVRLQRYKDGGVSRRQGVRAGRRPDLDRFRRAACSPSAATELNEWIGHRAEAGRLPPRGFPKNNRFG